MAEQAPIVTPPAPLPDCLTPAQKARYATIATIARRMADRIPHTRDEFVEPSQMLDAHIRK